MFLQWLEHLLFGDQAASRNMPLPQKNGMKLNKELKTYRRGEERLDDVHTLAPALENLSHSIIIKLLNLIFARSDRLLESRDATATVGDING